MIDPKWLAAARVAGEVVALHHDPHARPVIRAFLVARGEDITGKVVTPKRESASDNISAAGFEAVKAGVVAREAGITAAELLFGDSSDPEQGDEAYHVVELMRDSLDAREKARELIGPRTNEVFEVAEALMERGELSAAEIEEILGPREEPRGPSADP